MGTLFNYSTLKARIQKPTKTLIIELHRPDHKNAINFEMLFELETLFSWTVDRLEINTILLTSSSSYFCTGIDRNDMHRMDVKKLQKFLSRLQKLIFALFHLPHTVVVDMKNGAQGIGAELCIGADIRFGYHDVSLQFNHLSQGLCPSAGGVGFLSGVLNPSIARSWVLSGNQILSQTLKSSGFIQDTYNLEERETYLFEVLAQINKQAPVQRIQAKRSFLESIYPDLQRAMNFEPKISAGGLIAEDWKEDINAHNENRAPEFMGPKEMGQVVKKLHQENPL